MYRNVRLSIAGIVLLGLWGQILQLRSDVIVATAARVSSMPQAIGLLRQSNSLEARYWCGNALVGYAIMESRLTSDQKSGILKMGYETLRDVHDAVPSYKDMENIWPRLEELRNPNWLTYEIER